MNNLHMIHEEKTYGWQKVRHYSMSRMRRFFFAANKSQEVLSKVCLEAERRFVSHFQKAFPRSGKAFLLLVPMSLFYFLFGAKLWIHGDFPNGNLAMWYAALCLVFWFLYDTGEKAK